MTTQSHSKGYVAALDAAYRATSYVAQLPEGPLVLRVDVHAPALARLMRESGQKEGAFISACNPGSIPLDEAQNAVRHTQLLIKVQQLGVLFYQGMGIPEGTDWHPEPSLLILGISRSQAHALAAEFGQNALLYFEEDATPRLHYVCPI
ncbi:MAG: DUF3293 domain-containing protein [Methylophilaceae bacterium]|nr:DUF3293 domain-containing protein [Methylophilaceae bacterium]